MVETTAEHTRQMRTGNSVMSAGKGFPDKEGGGLHKKTKIEICSALSKKPRNDKK